MTVTKKLDLEVLVPYAAKITQGMCDRAYAGKERLTGEEVRYFSASEQLNRLILKAVSQQWTCEASKLRSAYFDYEEADVKQAMAAMMNTLSRHISIKRPVMEDLTKRAVMDLFSLAYTPLDYWAVVFGQIKPIKAPLVTIEDIKGLRKYYTAHKEILDAVIVEMEQTHSRSLLVGQVVQVYYTVMQQFGKAKYPAAKEVVAEIQAIQAIEESVFFVDSQESPIVPGIVKPAAVKEEVAHTPHNIEEAFVEINDIVASTTKESNEVIEPQPFQYIPITRDEVEEAKVVPMPEADIIVPSIAAQLDEEEEDLEAKRVQVQQSWQERKSSFLGSSEGTLNKKYQQEGKSETIFSKLKKSIESTSLTTFAIPTPAAKRADVQIDAIDLPAAAKLDVGPMPEIKPASLPLDYTQEVFQAIVDSLDAVKAMPIVEEEETALAEMIYESAEQEAPTLFEQQIAEAAKGTVVIPVTTTVSIRQLIVPRDRIMLLEQLFQDDANAYEEFLNSIDKAQNHHSATTQVITYSTVRNWDLSKPSVSRLLTLIEKKFENKG